MLFFTVARIAVLALMVIASLLCVWKGGKTIETCDASLETDNLARVLPYLLPPVVLCHCAMCIGLCVRQKGLGLKDLINTLRLVWRPRVVSLGLLFIGTVYVVFKDVVFFEGVLEFMHMAADIVASVVLNFLHLKFDKRFPQKLSILLFLCSSALYSFVFILYLVMLIPVVHESVFGLLTSVFAVRQIVDH